ncbi:MAG: type VII secretion protein EssC [Bacilli bacterium]|nr:type VII secretion protein EssC [Bacilli bacterium]
MNLYLFDEQEIISFGLPEKKVGNFWMTDFEGKNVVNIGERNGEWVISGGNNSKIIYDNNYVEEVLLKEKCFYIVEKNQKQYVLYSDTLLDNSFKQFSVNGDIEIKVGKASNNDIVCNCNYLDDLHLTLVYNNGIWNLKKNSTSMLYLNNKSVQDEFISIKNGDVINCFGLKIILAFNIIFINNPINNVVINNPTLNNVQFMVNDQVSEEELDDVPMYKDEDYFLKSPRLRRIIEHFDMKIDSPPKKEEQQAVPMIYTLGPMLTMGASSVVNITDTMSKIGAGEVTLNDSIPSLVVSGGMICSMFVWPFLTKNYEKSQKKKKEKKRQVRYKAYIGDKKRELTNEYNTQTQILEENLLSTEACYDIILNKKRTLWERKIEQNDFLTVRVGKGIIPFDAKINYQRADFSMDDDDLIKMLDNLVEEFSTLNNVPIGYSFADNNITAVNGLYPKKIFFVYNILLQMMAYHSYDNLKFVIFTNEKNKDNWNFLKISSYCFSDDKSIRFFATTTEEMQDISIYLDRIFQYRQIASENVKEENIYSKFNSYYLFIIDDIDLARKINIVDSILKSKKNLGFSLMILEDKLSKLPSQCTNFISIGDKQSGILKNDVISNSQSTFIDEVNNTYNMELCSYLLSNLPLYVEKSGGELPNTVTFLEMFGVGQVEQLNSLNRWKDNDPTKSLKTSVGVNENGDSFLLDLHEKQHGPHGLVAGMTGSGKSEFIITYILSMAVNYSPEEVSFVLIDYKGGGLAGAFENKELGIKLPHIVGTITNLDKTEINRALSSIDSELRRRQKKFNEVREKSAESTIDIYKYQKMYRDGKVDEPMPHLIIVSDEFAELKSQQPEFMDNLISTARIGRSLGVHLILATQKPSGVVDAQIWSNSKFKVCLKVQDKSDSMEMIKCDDAAELKNVGRFYLQVGYNEFFALGQSAWAGASYFPSKEYKKQVDKNIYFIDNTGYVYKSIDNSSIKKSAKSNGEELSNVLKYIIDVGNSLNLKIRQLWREKIPGVIYLKNLVKKYNYSKENFNINPVIGEYDDPSNQSQGLLTLPITKEGNVLIYGMADSGRDEFLQSFVYSIINTYDSTEVNLYLLDYGAETLMNFKDAPHVGGVVLNSDEEKLNNLIKMLVNETNKRKKLFVSYNGNYSDYIKMSGKTLPNIIVVVNVMEILSDNFLDSFDKLFPVIRDGSKYGINFVITTTNQNSIKFRVAQACKQLICLQLSNDTEYRDILGKTANMIPSKTLARGLIKLDKVCEFQTAFLDSDENKFNNIKETISILNQNIKVRAKTIPMMPEIIEFNIFNNEYTGIQTVPLGISKNDLDFSLYDFSKNVANIISSNELNNMKKFVFNYLKVLEMNNSFNKLVIDASNFFEEFNYNINLYNNNFDKVIDYLKKVDDEIQNILSNNNMNIRSLKNISNNLCVVIGFEKFYNKLDEEHKIMFKEILSHNKESLKINFVFIDIVSGFKKFEYEEWYKNCFDTDDGIWIGAGVTQQYVIKLLIQPSKLSNIDNEYGIVVKNGMPTLIKLINQIKC